MTRRHWIRRRCPGHRRRRPHRLPVYADWAVEWGGIRTSGANASDALTARPSADAENPGAGAVPPEPPLLRSNPHTEPLHAIRIESGPIVAVPNHARGTHGSCSARGAVPIDADGVTRRHDHHNPAGVAAMLLAHLLRLNRGRKSAVSEAAAHGRRGRLMARSSSQNYR